MVEVIIEQWRNRDGSVDYHWSAWEAGSRIHMGGAHGSGEEAEMEARDFCRRSLGAEPDRMTHL